MTVIGMLLLRLLVLPAVFVLTILEWVGTYILSFSEMFCRLITGLTAILSVAVFWIGVASIEQAASILIAGLVSICSKESEVLLSPVSLCCMLP